MKIATETLLLLVSGYVLSILLFPAQAVAYVAHGSEDKIATELPVESVSDSASKLYSEGKATWLWLDVYQAKLFTSEAIFNDLKMAKRTGNNIVQETFLADKTPINLQLCYQQEISAEQIIEAAQEGLPDDMALEVENVVSKLHDSYQSVKPDDCYELIHNQNGETILRFNKKEVFRTTLPGFKKIYYGIWIGERALSKSLKKSLLKEIS